MSINTVTIIGNLATAPKLADRAGDNKVCTFFVAVNERKDKNGNEREANFIPVKTWNGQALNCAKYLSVGSEVAVHGRITTSKYEKDGETRYGWEVVANEVTFLRRAKNSGEQDIPASESFVPTTEEPTTETPASASSKDDIPF